MVITISTAVAQWIRPRTLNREVSCSNLLAAAVVPLAVGQLKALYPQCKSTGKELKPLFSWLLAYKSRIIVSYPPSLFLNYFPFSDLQFSSFNMSSKSFLWKTDECIHYRATLGTSGGEAIFLIKKTGIFPLFYPRSQTSAFNYPSPLHPFLFTPAFPFFDNCFFFRSLFIGLSMFRFWTASPPSISCIFIPTTSIITITSIFFFFFSSSSSEDFLLLLFKITNSQLFLTSILVP